MAFKQTLFISAALLLLAPTCLAAGSPPPNVENVKAVFAEGKLTVTWSDVASPSGVASYRIYYSRKSILGNQGNYDDFEETVGAPAAYTFKTIPPNDGKLFVGVLAVSPGGVESDGFASEASVDISAKPNIQTPDPSGEPIPIAPPVPIPNPEMPLPTIPEPQPTVEPLAPSQPAVPPSTTDQPLTILSVSAVSETGVLVTFSKPIATDGAAITAFAITDTGGTALGITSIQVSAENVLIQTAAQEPQKTYVLGIVENVRAQDGTNATQSSPPVIFQGFGIKVAEVPVAPEVPQPENTPEQPVVTEPPVPYGRNPSLITATPYVKGPVATNLPPEDAVGLILEPIRQKGGWYNVLARWAGSPNTHGTLDSYGIYTAIGPTAYAWTGTASKTDTITQFTGIRPGSTFSVRLTARDAQGRESNGIERAVSLPGSGAGMLGIAAVSGFLAAKRRRKKEGC
jgi:hypothetical protein